MPQAKWTAESTWTTFINAVTPQGQVWQATSSMNITPAFQQKRQPLGHQIKVQIRGNVIRNA